MNEEWEDVTDECFVSSVTDRDTCHPVLCVIHRLRPLDTVNYRMIKTDGPAFIIERRKP